MKPATGSESGLTLLEVLVALGIMSMAIAIGLPMLQRGASPLQAPVAARQLVAALREARAAAIAENRTIAFWLDTGARSFGYGQRHFALPRHPDTGMLSLTLFTTEDQHGGSGKGTIRFFPGGGSTGGGVAVADGKRRLLVTIDWLSGQITLNPESVAHASR